MIKKLGKFTLIALLAATVLGVPARVHAQTTNATPPKAAKSKPLPFSGKIGAIDKVAKTITLEEKTKAGRTFEITSETKISKADKPATLDDATVGEAVSGSYVKTPEGKLIARSVYIGGKNPK